MHLEKAVTPCFVVWYKGPRAQISIPVANIPFKIELKSKGSKSSLMFSSLVATIRDFSPKTVVSKLIVFLAIKIRYVNFKKIISLNFMDYSR